jgi:opacity protein-like surface antigen
MMHRTLTIALATGLASAAFAADWDEIDSGGYQNAEVFPGFNVENFDAGKRISTANMTEGTGALGTIQLQLAYGSDVDIFAINIDDTAAFSVVGPDTNAYSLALFDENGVAIAYNAANATGGATIDSTLTTGLPAGLYYIAVVEDHKDESGTSVGPANALDAFGNEIFDLSGDPLDQVAPTVAGTALGTQDEVVDGNDVAGPWTHTNLSFTAFSSTLLTYTFTGASYAVDTAGCPADLNGDTILDLADIQVFVTAFTSMDPIADLVADGIYDLADVTAFVTSFVAGCP